MTTTVEGTGASAAVDYADYSHTGPDTLAGRYLRLFWQPIYRSQDLAPSESAPITIMSQELTVYRGESGTAHVIGGRCAHRNTLLSTGWVEGECVRCFYHGWKYDSSGHCIEQPAEDERFAAKIEIAGYPTEEYLGLIFVYLGEGEPPAMPSYPFLEGFDESRALRMTHVFKKGYNYRNALENSMDPVHVAFVHRNSEYRGLTGCPKVSVEETDYGMILRSIRPGGSLRITQLEMPTVLYIKQGTRHPAETDWRDFVLWRVPCTDESYWEIDVTLVYMPPESRDAFLDREEELMVKDRVPALAEECLQQGKRYHVADVTDFSLAVNIQDYVAQKGQGVIYDRTDERLGRSDVGVILIRRLMAREMQALHEGRPLTKWTPLPPLATTGLPAK